MPAKREKPANTVAKHEQPISDRDLRQVIDWLNEASDYHLSPELLMPVIRQLQSYFLDMERDRMFARMDACD